MVHENEEEKKTFPDEPIIERLPVKEETVVKEPVVEKPKKDSYREPIQ
jgi:hypothetical protein